MHIGTISIAAEGLRARTYVCMHAAGACRSSLLQAQHPRSHLPLLHRAEFVRKREKYEKSHMGGYTRIYPSDDPQLQVRGRDGLQVRCREGTAGEMQGGRTAGERQGPGRGLQVRGMGQGGDCGYDR